MNNKAAQSQDNRIVFAVIVFVGTSTLLAFAGIIGLAWMGKEVPDALTALGGGALGGLTAMLTTTRSGGRQADTPQQVEVMNAEANPVPVEESSPDDAKPAQ